MLLDCYSSVFLWIGHNANKDEKKSAVETAQKYVLTSNDGRDEDTPIMVVKAGAEPNLFSQHFIGWDDDFFQKNKFVDPYQAKLAELKSSQQAVEDDKPIVITATSKVEEVTGDVAEGTTFSLEVSFVQSSVPTPTFFNAPSIQPH